MKRHHIVTILLLAVACSGTESSEEWQIDDIEPAALERLLHREASRDGLAATPASASEMPEEEEVLESEDDSFVGSAGSAPRPERTRQTVTRRTFDKKSKSKPTTWRRSQIVPNTSKLAIGTKDELPLEATHATVRIDGFRARVVLDLLYRNDRNKQLQGILKLRLPEGASPDYTAFGVTARVALPDRPGTTLPEIRKQRTSVKEARMVPKEKAAHAYGETVRRRVDPALVEWAGAGVYNVRVFPLEPGKLHRITVAYDVDLTPIGDDLEYRLDLPEKSGDLEVDLTVGAIEHTVNGKPANKEGHYRFSKPDERTFRIRLAHPGVVALQGTDDATGDLYAMRFTPKLPAVAGDPAGDAIFLVDTSLSSNPERFNLWLDLLRAVLDNNRGTLKRFRVGFFNIETHWWRDGATANTPRNVEALLADAKKLALEGATDVGQALAIAARISGRHDLFLLSDGAATWGERDRNALHGRIGEDQTLFAYTTGMTGTDARMLRHLARESGGAVFSVTGADDLPAASKAHAQRPWRIVSVDTLLRGRPLTLFPGQTLVATGRGKAGAITLNLRQGDRALSVTTKPDRVIASPLARGIYGSIAVRQLEEFAHLTGDISRAYALHFGVVGETCSLLMLDSEDDYKRFKIEPAKDSGLVASSLVAPTVANALEHRAAALENPKARLVAALARLEKMPGMSFKQSTFLRDLLANASDDDFAVPAGAIACKARRWDEIPGAIQEQLAARKLKYDEIEAEALRRKEKYSASDALKALSSLVEQSPGDSVVARDVGFTAMEWGLGGEAYFLFRRVAEARPYAPHSYVAMAQCLDALGKTTLARVWYEVALAGEWNARYGDFKRIARVHYISMLRRHRDDRLETLLPATPLKAADMIVTVFWNTDNSDVDLHVADPSGEVCFYSHPATKMGGTITKDVTTGYGPEMFVLPDAKPGAYAAWVNYFSEDTTQTSTRTKIYATVFENWGRASEKAHTRTVVLETGRKQHPIAGLTKRDEP